MSFRKIKFLGVPFSFGQPHAGVALAPDACRDQALLQDLQNIAPTIDLGNIDFSREKNLLSDTGDIKNELASSIGCHRISQAIADENLDDSFLLNVGGDHGLGLGSVHGILEHSPDSVVVWADAHGDINPPTSSPSGNFHGMPLAFLIEGLKHHSRFSWLKNKLSPKKLIYFGPRDLDSKEKEIIDDLSIQYISSEDINRHGTTALLEEALQIADPLKNCPIHLSFDVDVCDADDVVATGTRVNAGPDLSEVLKLGEELAETGRLRSMDIVELNPELGNFQEVERSFDLAKEFALRTIQHVIHNESEAESTLRAQNLIQDHLSIL
jgi:arginase